MKLDRAPEAHRCTTARSEHTGAMRTTRTGGCYHKPPPSYQRGRTTSKEVADHRPWIYRYGGREGAEWQPGLLSLTPPPTHPPTDIRNLFLREKMKFIKGAQNQRSNRGTQTFCWPLPPGIGHGLADEHKWHASLNLCSQQQTWTLRFLQSRTKQHSHGKRSTSNTTHKEKSINMHYI